MGATLRSSTLFTNYETNKHIPEPRDRHGSLIPFYFEVTIVSASNISDTYDLFTIPANWSVAFIQATTNGLGASAGAGVTFQIGDSGDADRLMIASDFDANNAVAHLAYTGVAYRPTVDTIEECLIGTAAAVVGKLVKGHVFMIPAS